MSLVARRIFASQFTYEPRTRIFVGLAIELGTGAAGRVSTDGPDRGFVMVSERTKSEILCLWSGEGRDGSQKLWDRYLCYDLEGRSLRGKLAGAEVRVIC